MVYFIFDSNGYKLILTHLGLTFSEKNLWFGGEFSSDFSFPFDFSISELSKAVDFSDNASIIEMIFSGKLYNDGEMISATLKITEQEGNFGSAVIFYGLEGFPNFDKKLSELPLHNFSVANLKAHALTIINKDYPEVNYNFPMLHTNKYDATNEEYLGFLGIINNFSAGNFIENSLDSGTNLDEIKNLMQPLPYLLYLMKTAVESAGFNLMGDILQIEDLKKALVDCDANYFITAKNQKISFHYPYNDWDVQLPNQNGFEKVSYTKELLVSKKGLYVLLGTIYCLTQKWTFVRFLPNSITSGNYTNSRVKLKIVKNSEVSVITLFNISLNQTFPTTSLGGIFQHYNFLRKYDIDFELDLEIGDKIILEIEEIRRDTFPEPTPDYPEVSSLDLIPIRFKNPDNSPILSNLDLNEIDLKKVVPDMTVSDLFQQVRLLKNLDFNVSGTVVTMNFIKNKLLRNNAVDMSKFDVENPKKVFHDDKSFEIKYTSGRENSDYIYDSIFITKPQNFINNYAVKKTTEEISIDALPWPVVIKNSVLTAFRFADESSKLRLVFYNSIQNLEEEIPSSFENQLMRIPLIYEYYYKEWLKFRMASVGYKWNFIVPVERFREITAQTIIHAYNNHHIISEIEKERLFLKDESFWSVTISSETFT